VVNFDDRVWSVSDDRHHRDKVGRLISNNQRPSSLSIGNSGNRSRRTPSWSVCYDSAGAGRARVLIFELLTAGTW